MEEIMSKEEMLDMLRQLATPIDFERLVADGVLRKSGAWYVLLKPDELPEHASRQAYAMELHNGQRKLKFRKSAKRARALYEQIAGKPMDEV